MKIGILVGSLRKGSYNRMVANELIKLAPKSLSLNIIEIRDLSFFNQDIEENPPPEWLSFRDEVRNCSGFIWITPEYNRSVPAVIKNALDIASRPYGQNLWDNKPCAVISASIGATGGFGANHHLRQSMVFLNSPCLQQPEVYLSHVDKLFAESGKLNNLDTQQFLLKFLEAYEKWVTSLISC